MERKPRFVTIFTDTENFHLIKDVGQIPYFMYKAQGYDAELVTYQNNSDYPYLKNEVNGLKLTFIPDKGRISYFEKSVIQFLFKESKSIDVLNLLHFKRDNFIYLSIYKLLNPRGKSYIKLDIDILFFKNYNSFFFSNYKLKNYLLKILCEFIFRLTDTLSVESDGALDYLLKVYPELEEKLLCIPNGVDSDYLEKEITLKTFEEKENIIITVGRIGAFVKNTELLLEALKITDLKDWKVYIIGPIEESFQEYIIKFFNENPELKSSIIFQGNIIDRKELFEWYNRAKVFCLTSRWESFGIVFIEALYFGNHIITSPLSSVAYITDNGKYGTLVKTEAEEFSKAIQKSIEPEFLTHQRYEETRSFAKKNFTWPGIIKKLSDKLKS